MLAHLGEAAILALVLLPLVPGVAILLSTQRCARRFHASMPGGVNP